MRSGVGLALALALAATAAPARACTCVAIEARAAREAAAAVFEGLLLRHEERAGGTFATFRVTHVWKGAVGPTITVRTHGLLTMCPPHFEVGQRYVLYAAGTVEQPSVGGCMRFAQGDFIARERRALGRPAHSYAARGRAARRAPPRDRR